MKNQIQKAQIAICTNKNKNTLQQAHLHSRTWSITSSFVPHPLLKRAWSVDVLPQNTSLATMMNQSELDDTKDLKPKKMGEGVWGGGLIPHQALCLQSCVYRTRLEILNQKQGEKKCMSRGRGGAPTVLHLHPFPKPFLFNRTFLKAPSFPLWFLWS